MNFYEQIIDNISMRKTYIDKQFFSKPQLYIEAIHNLPTTNPKGKTFYKNLLIAIDQLKAHKHKKAIQASKDHCINRIEVFENGICIMDI